MKRNISKWRMLPLGLIMVLMGILGMKGAHAQCLDSVPWGTPLSFENSCCWTVAPGSDWIRYANFDEIISDGDPSADHRILSPWVQIPASAQQDSLALMYHTVSTCQEEYSVCVTTDGVHFDTLFRGRTPDEAFYYDDTLYIGAYAGQWVRFELCHYVLNSIYEPDSACWNSFMTRRLLFQNIRLGSPMAPVAMMPVPEKAFVGENTLFSASLYRGSHTGLTYTWHSSLMGQTFTGDSVTMVYTAAGMDTVTMVATNAFGNDTLMSEVQVFDCRGVIAANPWMVNFETDYDCWRTVGDYGWSKYYYNNNPGIMGSSSGHSTIASPAVALPADSTGLRLYWKDRRMSYGDAYYVMVSRDGRFDLDDYDTLYTSTSQNYSLTQRSASLANYAGDTVYIAFRQKYQMGFSVFVTDVKMYNALVPMVSLEAPTTAVATGDTVRYILHLSQGDNITYTWHSSLLDTTIVTIDSVLSIVYSFPGSETLTVTATNAYGSDSAQCTIHVKDCTPQTTLPWRETFAEGTVCWYKPEGSKFYDAIPYGNSAYERLRHLYLNTQKDTLGSWIMSKAIEIPADTNFGATLFWKVASSDNYYHHLYSVLATTADDYTDTANYTVLYTDSSNHINFSNYDTRSVSLAQYAGQTVHVAIHNHGHHNVPGGIGLYFDDIEVRTTQVPIVRVTADASTYYYGDTARFTATLQEGSTNGITYTWHSTMLDSTVTINSNLFTLNYTQSGVDTVTVIATNAYGSDTASVIVNSTIITQPQVTLQHTDANVGEPTVFTAVLNRCVTEGLTYTWHSAMLDSTITLNSNLFTLNYTQSGVDTVTVVATNIYGSDTAVANVYVVSRPLPQVTLSAPAEIPLGDSVTLSATLNDCSLNALTLTLYSSLMDTTITDSSHLSPFTYHLSYSHSGVDTLTLVASNAYGADTAFAIVRVYDCGNVAVPYFMDFEDVTATNYNVASQLPICWNRTWNGSNTAFAPHVIPVGGYPYLSNLPSKSLLMLAGNASGYGNQAEVVLPRFADSLQHLSFAFDYRFEASSWGVFSVGYYDTTGTFVTVRNLSPYTGAYRRDTVVFSSVTLPDAQIVMRWTNSNSYYALAIDNIHVFVDNNIPAPVGLTADNITASCATLRWNAVPDATAYHLILPGIVDTLLADTALSVCGLDEDSDYGFGVYAHVGDEVGHFSGYHPFHTLLYCTPLVSLSANVAGIVRWQYGTTGEAMGTGVALEIADITNGTTWANTVLGDSLVYPFAIGHRYSINARTLCGNAEAHTTLTIPLQIPASVCAEAAGTSTATDERFMDNFWEHNYSQIIYPASFATGIDSLFGIALRVSQFSQPFADTANYNYDIFIGQTDSATLSAPLTSDSLTQVAFNKRFTIRSAGWIEIPFDSVYPLNPTGNLIVTLVERTSNAYDGRHYGVHADATCTHFVQSTDNLYYTNPSTLNFDWEVTTDIPDIRLLGGCNNSLCLAPVAAISAVDTHYVELQWVARGSEGLWQVEYRPAGQTAWTVADTTNANSYTVDGLHAMTTYEFRVASICDGGLQYGSTLTATTPCGEISLPYYINFRNNEIPCWTIHTGVSHSSSYGLNMYSGEWAISPLVDDNIGRLYATITSYGGSSSSYPESYAVGICNADGSNPMWVDTIVLSTQYGNHQHTVYFNNYSGMGDHIIVKIVSGLLDLREFALDYVDFCIPAQNVEATAITDSSAVLQWTANASGHTFAVYLDDVLQTVTSATTYTFTGLAPRTRHLAAVREICGAGDTAAAATRYFRTQCTPTTDLPYFEEFDYSSDLYGDTIGLPPCWDSIGYPHISFSSFSGGALTVMTFYSFEDYSGPYTSYLATPLLNIPSQGARIRFKGQTGHDDAVTAGIMTDPTDASTFIPMATITYNNRGLAWYEFTTEGLDSLNSQFAVAFRWASEGSGSLDSLIVTALPVRHTVTVTANEEGVCETYGSGIYADSSSVEIGYRMLDTLTQGGHWEFLGWSDSASGNPRTLFVTSDTAVVALFEWVTDPVTDTVWRTVAVRLVDLATGNTIEESDVVYVEGAGRYVDSTMVTLTAHYADDPLFYGWVTIAGDTISSNPYRFIVTCDTLITAVYAPLPVGIEEVESEKWKVEIFPNPATTEVTILTQAIKQSDNQAITILDLHGRVVYTQAIKQSDNQAITIDISTLPRGVYYVRIGTVVKKLVII